MASAWTMAEIQTQKNLAQEVLQGLLHRKDPWIRGSAALALLRIGHFKVAIDPLFTLTTDHTVDPWIRGQAFLVLLEITSKLGRSEEKNLLSKLEEVEDWPFLLALTWDYQTDDWEFHVAPPSLQFDAQRDAMETLLEMAIDPKNPSLIRGAGLMALSHEYLGETRDSLVRILDNDEDAYVRQTAATGLISNYWQMKKGIDTLTEIAADQQATPLARRSAISNLIRSPLLDYQVYAATERLTEMARMAEGESLFMRGCITEAVGNLLDPHRQYRRAQQTRKQLPVLGYGNNYCNPSIASIQCSVEVKERFLLRA
jgi:hypothetical protein